MVVLFVVLFVRTGKSNKYLRVVRPPPPAPALAQLASTVCYHSVLQELLAYAGRALDLLVQGIESQEAIVPEMALALFLQLCSRQEGPLNKNSALGCDTTGRAFKEGAAEKVTQTLNRSYRLFVWTFFSHVVVGALLSSRRFVGNQTKTPTKLRNRARSQKNV